MAKQRPASGEALSKNHGLPLSSVPNQVNKEVSLSDGPKPKRLHFLLPVEIGFAENLTIQQWQ